jgi:hypothetical protein
MNTLINKMTVTIQVDHLVRPEGKLDIVVELSAAWFRQYLSSPHG